MSANLSLFQVGGNCPHFNVKSTIVSCNETGYIFLYGGFDDMDALDSNVYLLNLNTRTWEIDDQHNGLYREGHLAIYIGNGNILVFGGIPFDDFPIYNSTNPSNNDNSFNNSARNTVNSNPTSNDITSVKIDLLMMIYNIFNRKWIGPPKFALDGAPSSRSRHACCLSPDGSKLYISGGLVQSTPLDDLYCYDLTSGIWQGPIQFVPRFDHFITIYGDKLFTFGGLDKDMNHAKDTITWYSLSNGTIGEIKILQKSNNDPRTQILNEISPHDHERIYLNSNINPAIKLAICLPLWSTSSNEFNISYVDLSKYEFKDLFNMNDLVTYFKKNNSNPIDILTYVWKLSFVNSDGSLFLLGSKKSLVNVEDDIDDEELHHDSKLSSILQLKLDGFGVPIASNKVISQLLTGPGLADSFRTLLLNQQYTDFEIICKGKDSLDHTLKVHKAILVARWPHFQRMIVSGMTETILNCMEIPEPYNWVRGLVHFLYTGSIDFEDYLSYTLLDFSGLLMLSNMYELPVLRSLVLCRLFSLFEEFQTSITVSNGKEIAVLVNLWKDLSFSNEDIFIIRVIGVIKRYWSAVTHSDPFLKLSKDEIVKLCQDCSSENELSDIGHNSHSNSSSLNNSIPEFSDLEAPTRNTNSPFVIDSPNNRSTIVDSASFSNLQRLSGVLNDNL